MKFGDAEVIRKEGHIRLLKIGCRYDRIVYCVGGGGRTRHYEDYEDALEEFNLRWMRQLYGDEEDDED